MGAGKDVLQTQHFQQNCSHSYDVDPPPAYFTNAEVVFFYQLLLVLGLMCQSLLAAWETITGKLN